MPVLPWEKTITCPYNPSHQITEEKIQWHLVKCRKNHRGSDMAICPFNASHHVPRPELGYHLSICSDRKHVEVEMYRWGGQEDAGERREPPSTPCLPPSEEDWEAEATVRTSYNPSLAASKRNVLRKVEGATPSQRKEFRAQERQRHEELDKRQERGQGPSRQEVLPPRRESLGALRRPTLGEARPGSSLSSCGPPLCSSSLLAAHIGGGRGSGPAGGAATSRPQLRRPGSFSRPLSLDTTAGSVTGPPSLNTSTNSLNQLSTSMDTTLDTLDQAIAAAGHLSIGRGRRLEARPVPGEPRPLRRPSIGPGAATN